MNIKSKISVPLKIDSTEQQIENALSKRTTIVFRQHLQSQNQPSLLEYDREVLYLKINDRKYTRITIYFALTDKEKESRQQNNRF